MLLPLRTLCGATLVSILAAGPVLVPGMVSAQEQNVSLASEYLPIEASGQNRLETHLADFFTPSFDHKDVKITDQDGNRKLVTITADGIVNGRTVRKLNETLLSRGINIYGAAYYGEFSWDKTVTDAAVTATRKVEGEADTIEVSEGIARDPKSGLPVVPLTASVGELYIALRDDFGKKWEKIRIMPSSNEPTAAEPKTGRYPGSKIREVQLDDAEKKHVFYVVKGNLQDVGQYFENKLREVHKTVLVAGDVETPPSPAKVFGVRTSARLIVLSGYTYSAKKLSNTEVTLRKSVDPNLADYVEIEAIEN